MNDFESSNHDDLLERATRALGGTPVPDGPPEEVVTDLMAALPQVDDAAAKPRILNLKQRIVTMKPMTKISTAAALLIAFGALFTWLAPNRGVALAFTDFAEAFAAIRTATCTMTTELDGPEGKVTQTSKASFLAPSRERVEIDMNGAGATMIMIADGQQGKTLNLMPGKKLAILYEMENVPPDQEPANSFEGLRKLVSDAQEGGEGNVDSLGEDVIDGRRVVGFKIRVGGFEGQIWAEPETALPVRVEYTRLFEPKVHLVMSDFQIDVKLDESLFSLEVPEGYTVQEIKMDVSKPTADDLVRALQVAAEQNDGLFPAKLHGAGGMKGIMGKAFAKIQLEHGEDSPEMLAAISEFTGKFSRGLALLMSLSDENDYHYVGKDVKLDTPDRAIFWYKPSGSDTYRVIYADLSIKEVAADDLPEVP